jgi:hypothetical protein
MPRVRGMAEASAKGMIGCLQGSGCSFDPLRVYRDVSAQDGFITIGRLVLRISVDQKLVNNCQLKQAACT